MHASYLIICPRFMLELPWMQRKTVDRRTDGRTHAHMHTHTHRQTDCNNPRCACAQERVNNVCSLTQPASSQPQGSTLPQIQCSTPAQLQIPQLPLIHLMHLMEKICLFCPTDSSNSLSIPDSAVN